MGTSYYHRTNICGSCSRYDETHICRSMTSFQAVVDYETDEVIVGSWAGWIERLLSEPGKVFDEHRTEIPILEFIHRVNAVEPKWRRRQYDLLAADALYRDELVDEPTIGKTWLDPQGYTFSGFGFE